MAEVRTDERAIVIDDDSAMRLSCQQILARMGLAVETFSDRATPARPWAPSEKVSST